MVVTHVTQWGVPGLKCTRCYGVIFAQLLKTSEINSHGEHHKRMGTRLDSVALLKFCLPSEIVPRGFFGYQEFSSSH